MIRPDPVLQSVVDKLFPQAKEADEEAERQFYQQRGLPLPDHLLQRTINRSIEDLDTSIAARSEADSETMSELASADVSVMTADGTSNPSGLNQDDSTSSPRPQNPSNEQSSSTSFAAFDQSIDEIVSSKQEDEKQKSDAIPTSQHETKMQITEESASETV